MITLKTLLEKTDKLAPEIVSSSLMDISKCGSYLDDVSREYLLALARAAVWTEGSEKDEPNTLLERSRRLFSSWVREDYDYYKRQRPYRPKITKRWGIPKRKSPTKNPEQFLWGERTQGRKFLVPTDSGLRYLYNLPEQFKKFDEDEIAHNFLNLCDKVLMTWGVHSLLWFIFFNSFKESIKSRLNKLGVEKDNLDIKESQRVNRHLTRTLNYIKDKLQL